MRTRNSVYMVLFSIIIFGWAFGMVALVYYVQNSTQTRQSHASNKIEQSIKLPFSSPTPYVYATLTSSITPTTIVSPVTEPLETESQSKFGQILTPVP